MRLVVLFSHKRTHAHSSFTPVLPAKFMLWLRSFTNCRVTCQQFKSVSFCNTFKIVKNWWIDVNLFNSGVRTVAIFVAVFNCVLYIYVPMIIGSGILLLTQKIRVHVSIKCVLFTHSHSLLFFRNGHIHVKNKYQVMFGWFLFGSKSNIIQLAWVHVDLCLKLTFTHVYTPTPTYTNFNQTFRFTTNRILYSYINSIYCSYGGGCHLKSMHCTIDKSCN